MSDPDLHWFKLDVVEKVHKLAPVMALRTVRFDGQERSPIVFLTDYRKAKGSFVYMKAWRAWRAAWLRRRQSSGSELRQPLFLQGAPSTYHFELAVWGFSPRPVQLMDWLSSQR